MAMIETFFVGNWHIDLAVNFETSDRKLLRKALFINGLQKPGA